PGPARGDRQAAYPAGRALSSVGHAVGAAGRPAAAWRAQRRDPVAARRRAAGDGQRARGRLMSAERQPPVLEGVRIADFSWIGAGSYATKLLADLGAEVIKIESSVYPDLLRTSRPFKDGVPGVNRSGYFADRNASKRS